MYLQNSITSCKQISLSPISTINGLSLDANRWLSFFGFKKRTDVAQAITLGVIAPGIKAGFTKKNFDEIRNWAESKDKD